MSLYFLSLLYENDIWNTIDISIENRFQVRIVLILTSIGDGKKDSRK